MRIEFVKVGFACLAATALSASAALGQTLTSTNTDRDPSVRSLSEIAASKPHVNRLRAPDTSSVRAETGSSTLVPGSTGATGGGTSPRAWGSFGIPYTSTRVALGLTTVATSFAGHPWYLSNTYPYRAIGRLTFDVGGFVTHCSATVIRKGLIVTAAHCVQDFGTGNTHFTDFEFTPGYWATSVGGGAQARYATWTWRHLVRATAWSNGTDIGSGAARDNDIAIIALNKNASNQFIGQLTGTIGYGWNNYSFVSSAKTGNLKVAATSTLGYPGLMDGGHIMQRADGPSYLTTVGGAGQIWQGNNFTGGSSGGPWITNFISQNPTLSGGAVIGSQPIMSIVGVTSWGTSDPNAPKDNYASQFRQNTAFPLANYGGRGAGNIGALVNAICSIVEGGQTLAAKGYCNP